METIRNLIHADLIHLQGKKHNLLRQVILLVLISFGLAMLGPSLPVIMQLILALWLPSHLTNLTESTAPLYGILPADRKDIVCARFLLLCGWHTMMTLLMLLFSRLSAAFDWPKRFFGDDTGEIMRDILRLSSSRAALAAMILCFGYAVTVGLLAMLLRKHFRQFGKDAQNRKTLKKKVLRIFAGIGIVILLDVFVFAAQAAGKTITEVGTLLSIIASLLSALAEPLNGLLLCLIFLAAGICGAVRCCADTALKFEQTDI